MSYKDAAVKPIYLEHRFLELPASKQIIYSRIYFFPRAKIVEKK